MIDILYLIWIIFAFFLIIFSLSYTIILIHELGHAIPALIFTRKNTIEIYVGSYLDKKKTLKFKIGRLSFFIKLNYNFFKPRGICRLVEPIKSFVGNFIFIVGGPVLNLITGTIVFYFVSTFTEGAITSAISSAFIYCSGFFFIENLIPRKYLGKDGIVHKTDGKRLQELFKQKKWLPHAKRGDAFFNEKNYQAALTEYQKCIQLGLDPLLISDILSSTYIQVKYYQKAEEMILPKIENSTANFLDYYNASRIFVMKKDFNQSIIFIKKALEIVKDNKAAFNVLGFCLIETGNFIEAEDYLLKALEDELSKPFALNNLGYLKIITGKLEEGFLLVEQSIAIDATNGYAYRNRGIYYFKKGEFNLAKIDFEKAYNLETDILHLDVWMKEVLLKTA